MGREGFEPPKRSAADLQSAPVDHLGICPISLKNIEFLNPKKTRDKLLTPPPLITNQLLYQLSYASKYLPKLKWKPLTYVQTIELNYLKNVGRDTDYPKIYLLVKKSVNIPNFSSTVKGDFPKIHQITFQKNIFLLA